ncbi:MAG: hypothetical protein KA792_08885 [Bacteroidales bacterium]|nr:hypothetical protein [Bacteroidales bacterium]
MVGNIYSNKPRRGERMVDERMVENIYIMKISKKPRRGEKMVGQQQIFLIFLTEKIL